MTEIERKALALLRECAEVPAYVNLQAIPGFVRAALFRAIERHEAFKQEVSDAVIAFMMDKPGLSGEGITRFIIAKPDPLEEAVEDWINNREFGEGAASLRAAIEKRGGKIVWGEGA